MKRLEFFYNGIFKTARKEQRCDDCGKFISKDQKYFDGMKYNRYTRKNYNYCENCTKK